MVADYVGSFKYSRAQIYNVNGIALKTGAYSMTERKYNTLFGFKINFKPNLLGSSSFQHILNVGGTGANTVLCLSVTTTNTLQLEVTPNSSGKVVVGSVPITLAQDIFASYIVDNNNVGHFVVNDVEVGTVTVDPTYTTNQNIYLFNSSTNNRPANILYYVMRTYTRSNIDAVYKFDTDIQQSSGAYLDIMQSDLRGTPVPLSGTYTVYPRTLNSARPIKNIYVGVNGVARKIKCGYVGVNGVARLCYGSSNVPPVGQSFSSYSAAFFDYYPTPGDTAAKIFVQFDHNEDIAQNITGSGWIDVECVDDPTITFGFATSDLDFSTPGAIMYTISNPWWGYLVEQHPGYTFQLYIGDDNLIDNNTGITNPPLYIPLTLNIMPV